MSKKILWLFLAILALGFDHTQDLTPEEQKLYNAIMKYRAKYGLPKIPLSSSLNFVARTHVVDLVENKPDLSAECNAHSWSDKGDWTACCYTSDHKEAQCLWDKPRELTSYTGNGYEISCGSNTCCSTTVMTAQKALQSWAGSSGHNNVILNKGIWHDNDWQAIGVGLYKSFAVVWFGEEKDE